ncbi:MAG: hypothetical protein PHE27_07855, partial [Alphaproteobacteria bacterium]|nr:hypothetical protein [Alphaproteobacteria bacterium]
LIGASALFAAGGLFNLAYNGPSSLSIFCFMSTSLYLLFADEHGRIAAAEIAVDSVTPISRENNIEKYFIESKYSPRGLVAATVSSACTSLAVDSVVSETPRAVTAILGVLALAGAVAAQRYWNKAAAEATILNLAPCTPECKYFSLPACPTEPK